ncbi:hypothetical protein CVT26_014137 [Gymnopilus dilepis]|uniref:5'-Nucleotidase C-terminal domain-containing protein n=1 Tax=Gymnopilus dilepis TaxID=231916 RepID=A0A409VUD6_9AGAR|nr:hypothetical protein CVT26_014137 [Gymnopilus dilepis]
MTMTSISLPILHFNDVYRATPQRVSSSTSETIDVSQFAALMDDLRSKWPSRPDGERDGLVLFSGDVFSPSVESTITRGSHMDISLAKDLFALSPSAQRSHPISSEHGVDIILGGHDHIYFASRGISSWNDYDTSRKTFGAEHDQGDILVIKSGTDFRDLSEIIIKLVPTTPNSVRRMVISEITGRRHEVVPMYRSSENMSKLLKVLLSSVSSAMKTPVCRTTTVLDVRSSNIRLQESPSANWFSDIARHVYDDALCMKGCDGSDGVFFCAGTFRGDSVYGPGIITLGDVLEILPFQDPVIVLEVDGQTIWEAMESSLSTWPAQEGRFPSISGFRVEWDSRKAPGQRVSDIWLVTTQVNGSGAGAVQRGEEPVKNESGGKKYIIVTREYMAQGHDGYTALTKGRVLIDGECGSTLSTIVRKYLLASKFVNRMVRHKTQNKERSFLQLGTSGTIDGLHKEVGDASKNHQSNAAKLWEHAVDLAIHRARKRFHYQSHFKICETEHMSLVDDFDGANARKGRESISDDAVEAEDLPVVSPEIDGRLKDLGRPSDT